MNPEGSVVKISEHLVTDDTVDLLPGWWSMVLSLAVLGHGPDQVMNK